MENGELSLTHKRNLDNINITTRLGHCQSCPSLASPGYVLQAVVTNPLVPALVVVQVTAVKHLPAAVTLPMSGFIRRVKVSIHPEHPVSRWCHRLSPFPSLVPVLHPLAVLGVHREQEEKMSGVKPHSFDYRVCQFRLTREFQPFRFWYS